jgi:hypothetical protein
MRTQHVILIGLAMAFAIFLGWMIPRQPMFPVLMVAALIAAITIQHHGRIAIVLMLTTISSAFILPHAARPYVWEVSSLFAFSGVFGALSFRRWPPHAQHFLRRNGLIIHTCIVYGLLLAFLMIRHGVGLRILGSSTMGARFYLQQIILVPLPLCAILFPLKRKTATILVLIQLGMSFTFIISEAFFRFGLPGASMVLRFVELQSDTLNFTISSQMGGISRYQSIGVFSYNLCMVLLVLYPMRKLFSKQGIYLIPLFALLLIALGLGGSRRWAIQFILIFAFMAWSQKSIGIREMWWGFAVMVLGILLLYANIEHLPLSIQRTFSIFPGIEIDPIAQADANITMSLRRALRAEAVRIISENFWLGVGFGIDPNLLLIHNPTIGAFEQHALGGNFYSGPIGVFANLGVIAFVLFVLLQAGMLRLALRIIALTRGERRMDMFHRISLLLVAQYLTHLFIYTFITGDASTALKSFVPYAVMMLVCERILWLENRGNAEAAAAAAPALAPDRKPSRLGIQPVASPWRA